MSLLSTFGFGKPDYDRYSRAPYNACLMLELWRDPNGRYYVKVRKSDDHSQPHTFQIVYRRNGVLQDLTADIAGCDSAKCSFDAFVRRSLTYRPSPDVETVRRFVMMRNTLDLVLRQRASI